MIRFAMVLMILTLSVASAASYTVETFWPLTLAGTELKPGAYTLNVDNDNLTWRGNNVVVETNVKVAITKTKNKSTKFIFNNTNENQVKEIYLRGTNIKLIMN